MNTNDDQTTNGQGASDMLGSVLGAVAGSGATDGVANTVAAKTDELIDSVKDKLDDVLPEGIADKLGNFIDEKVNNIEEVIHAKTGMNIDLNGDETMQASSEEVKGE